MKAIIEKQRRQWMLKTINVNGTWFSRDGIGERIWGYMNGKPEWAPWAGRVTGMILQNEDYELKAVLLDEK